MPLGLQDTQGAVLLAVMPQAGRDTQLCGFAPQVRIQGFGLGFRTYVGLGSSGLRADACIGVRRGPKPLQDRIWDDGFLSLPYEYRQAGLRDHFCGGEIWLR